MDAVAKTPRRIRPCLHFNGIQHAACKAGVNYEALTGGGAGHALKLPCVVELPGQKPSEKVKCDQQRPETTAEALAREAETDRVIEEMLGVNKAVHDFEEANGGKLLSQHRRMDCPQCKVVGALDIYRIPTRLYVYCDTPKCVGYEANLGGSVFDPDPSELV